MTERYVLAIDQGTTGTKALVFDGDCRPVGDAYATHEQSFPETGWVEHDPVELWNNARTTLTGAISDAGIDAETLAAIGITNQRETIVAWEAESGQPVHPAIVWQDRRTTDRIEEIEELGKSAWIRERTGLEPDAYFSATKMEWLLSEVDGIRARAEHGEVLFGTVDSWLVYKLTGRHVTDVTNASRTMLFDLADLSWDEELLDEFDIPRAALPEIRPSIEPEGYGTTDPEGVLGAEIPVAAALGDQQAALFGQACFEPGDAKNTYGTGSFLLTNTGTEPVRSDHGLLTTVAFQRVGERPRYALEGAIFVTGAAIEWLAEIDLIADPAESEELARRVDDTDGVYFVPAFQGLGAPQWDGRARGTIVGLTRGTRREHVVRAALEGIAFRTRDVVEAMETDAGIEIDRLRVDGGAIRNDELCAIQANVLGSEIVRPTVQETTAAGAAFAAGLAAGVWEGYDDLRRSQRIDRTFEPDIDPAVAETRYERWIEAVERSRDWAREG